MNYILLLGKAPSPWEVVIKAELLKNVPLCDSPGSFFQVYCLDFRVGVPSCLWTEQVLSEVPEAKIR